MSDDEKSSSAGTGLTFPQIAAGALASATSAVLGSFLGVLGTIGGAAVASIILTVGTALYQRSLERTRDRVKERLVVGGTGQSKVVQAVARVTGKQPAVTATGSRPASAQQGAAAPVTAVARPGVAGPGRAPAGPGGRGPVPAPMQPGQRPGVPPRAPLTGPPGPPGPPGRPGAPGDRTTGRAAPGRTVDTRVHPHGPGSRVENAPFPTSRIPDARVTGTPPGGVGSTARFGQGPGARPPFPPTGGGDAVTTVVAEPPRRRRVGTKGWLALGGLAVSVFAIGLFASFAVETAAGHPLSGGERGTSVGSLFGQNTGTATPTPSEAPATTDSTSPDGTSEQGTRSSTPDRNRTTTSRPSSQDQQNPQNGQQGQGGQQDQQGGQQDQQGGSSQRRLAPSQLVPQLGGGSDSNG